MELVSLMDWAKVPLIFRGFYKYSHLQMKVVTAMISATKVEPEKTTKEVMTYLDLLLNWILTLKWTLTLILTLILTWTLTLKWTLILTWTLILMTTIQMMILSD